MEVITKYKAYDDVEFLSAEECEKHESNCKGIRKIMSVLPTKPESCDFSNGSGFLQHDKKILIDARRKFCEFAKRYTDHQWLQQTIDGGLEMDSSWAGRIISECCPNSISKEWYRFQCIDSELREWGQQYYSAHPEAAKQIQLN